MSEIFSSYLTIAVFFMAILSPALIPAGLHGVHAYREWRRSDLPRERILDQLGSGPRPKLVLIHAPGGYGKSVVAKQWVKTLTKQKVKTAWLSVDSDDNNAVWFLGRLIDAVRGAMPALADTLQQEFEGHLENVHQYVLNALIRSLH